MNTTPFTSKINTLTIIVTFYLFVFATQLIAQQTSLWDEIPADIQRTNTYKRFEWFYRPRAFPYDTISISTYTTERDKLRSLEQSNKYKQSQIAEWTQLGPRGIIYTSPAQWGTCSGRVRALAIHPTDPTVVYLGAAGGGLWKTTDGGLNWNSLSDEFASNTFGAIAIDPSNPNNIYAGAGEAMYNFNHVVYNGKGLFKSTDAGATWMNVTSGFGTVTHFGALAVSPFQSNIILAGLGSGYSYLGNLTNEGIWRSGDSGNTWAKVIDADNGFDVVFHPLNENRVYAGCGGGATAGFYFSTDMGLSWNRSTSGLPTSGTIARIQLSVPTSSPSTIFALIYKTDGTMQLYKSTNDGVNWGAVSQSYTSGQGWYDLLLGVNPQNPNEVYIGDQQLRYSSNGGQTFSTISQTHVDYHIMRFAPSNPTVRYLGCDGGIYTSTNGGTSWVHRNAGLSTLQFYRIASHPTNPDIVIAGAQDNGTSKTSNKGETPWNVIFGADGMECFIDYENENTYYVSYQNGALLKSVSNGNPNTFSNVTPPWETSPDWTTPFLIHPENHEWIYGASRSIFRSINGGSSWDAISSNVTGAVINSLHFSRVNANRMMLAASTEIKVSTDGGFTWGSATPLPQPTRYISRVVPHPTDETTIFAVRSGFGSGKAFRSTNFGLSWENISGDLPDVPHSDMFVDPHHTNHYYVANDLGVYLSTNAGINWTRQGNGLPVVPALDFDYFEHGTERLLRVGTHGRSAFETRLMIDSVASILASPSQFVFSKVETFTHDTIEATIRNVGAETLSVSSITNISAQFQLLDLPTFPVHLAFDENVEFKISFSPEIHGETFDTISITSNDPNAPISKIYLTGKGVHIGKADVGKLYAASNTGTLYSLNTSTGTGTEVGALTVGELHGLAIHPTSKELFGIRTNSSSSILYRVSSMYGEVIPSATLAIPNLRAIAFRNDGTLFAGTTSGDLFTINEQTGEDLFIGNASNMFYSGFSFQPANQLLFASVRPPISGRDKIYTVNTTNGQVTLIGNTGDNQITPSLTFDAFGNLYGLKGSGTSINNLIHINPSTGTGTVIGSTGVLGLLAITMRTDSGLVSVSENRLDEIPAALFLEQNYPNPFNPVTKFTFGIPSDEFVTLKIFNLLGEEVFTLIQKELQAGTYSIEWNAAPYPSGMYFYRLQTKNFSETKRMILMK